MRPCDNVIQTLFQIANKNAVTVDFILNDPQRKYSATATTRDIILKARREGFSSYSLAEFTVACLSEQNTAAVVMSHEGPSTERHLARVHFYLKHLKGPKPVLHRQAKNFLSFPKTDSTFYIGTAGAKTFGRGDTITHLHLSEAAFYESPKAIVGGALQAASHAKRIIFESTANSYNWFKRLCDKAAKGRGRFRRHFYAWFEDPDNQLTPPKDYEFEDDDWELLKQFKLLPSQLYWYIVKREEFMDTEDDMEGLRLFKQEYPCTPEEAFQASGAPYIGIFTYEELKPIEVEGKLKIYEKFIEGHRYVIGGDIGAGIGQDPSVADVYDITSMRQVAVWRDSWTEPGQFAHVMARLGRMYGDAFLIPELNNHGILTIDVLKRIYPIVKIYRKITHDAKSGFDKKKKTLGFLTTEKSKFHLTNALKLYLRRNLVIVDSQTAHELRCVEEIDGKLQAPEGEFDDCVMAAGLACMGIRKLVKDKPKQPVTQVIQKIDYTKPLFPWANIDEASEYGRHYGSSR
jgi:hypothetical protein